MKISVNLIAAIGLIGILAAGSTAKAGHFYGATAGDPAVDVISGVLFGDGTLSGILPASAPQPNEDFVHIIFNANFGDNITVDTNGSDMDTGLAINTDDLFDGILVGDFPNGADLTLLEFNDDSGIGLDSLINFIAPYSGQYLASIAELGSGRLSWVLTVSGSTAVPVPEPATLAIFGLGLAGLGLMRRRKRVAA